MKRLFSFFHGLRGKLILTYTLVTVLALLGLEILILALVVFASSMTDIDKRAYLGDVHYTLYPQASDFLQPGDEDIAGLQSWLEEVYASGRASLEPPGACMLHPMTWTHPFSKALLKVTFSMRWGWPP